MSLVAGTASAMAHPGHGPTHFAVRPEDMGFLLVVGVAAFCFFRSLGWGMDVPKRIRISKQ